MTFKELVNKFKSHKAALGIIGLGYVGLPLAREFSAKGFKIVGFDIDPAKVEKLRKGESYIKHIPESTIREMIECGRFEPTVDFARLEEVDAVIICVPTPLGRFQEPDLSAIINTTGEIAKHLRSNQLVVLESTTYPGTTDEVVKPILEKNGLKAGKDFYLAFSPEREDPGNPKFSARTIPKVVGGYTPECTELAAAMYGEMALSVVPVSSTRVAEAAKILENIYRSVNIALVNELKVLFNEMGIDVWEVIRAASTKPFGFQPFYPGPGLGGHCIPIDPFYLSWKAKEYEVPTRFIELAGEVNASMPQYVVERAARALSDRGKPLKGAKILVLGVAYKPDVDDIRESPALKVISLLLDRGADVSYHDPYIPVFPPLRHYPELKMKSVPLAEKTLKSCDSVLIITNHACIDYEFIVRNAPLVVDTRNAVRGIKAPEGRIIKA
jgi:UDP-N-acetyl-D-glucosamine dehydrogenase